jgi:hypothetical protein
MKISSFSILFFAVLFSSVFSVPAQDIKFAGTKPPVPAVVELVRKYEKALTEYKTVAERDANRKPLLSREYFYVGTDGTPIDSAGLTARQTRNDFKLDEIKRYDYVLFQYENTAILTYHSYEKGMDKGKPFEGRGTFVTVMGKEDGVWKIVSDIIGQDPPDPSTKR